MFGIVKKIAGAAKSKIANLAAKNAVKSSSHDAHEIITRTQRRKREREYMRAENTLRGQSGAKLAKKSLNGTLGCRHGSPVHSRTLRV